MFILSLSHLTVTAPSQREPRPLTTPRNRRNFLKNFLRSENFCLLYSSRASVYRSATSPRESFGFQREGGKPVRFAGRLSADCRCLNQRLRHGTAAAETLHSRVFGAFVNAGCKIGYIRLCMRPHLQPVFPCLAVFHRVWQSVAFVNILSFLAEGANTVSFSGCLPARHR